MVDPIHLVVTPPTHFLITPSSLSLTIFWKSFIFDGREIHLLDLLSELKNKRKPSVLTITHDLGIIAEICDRVTVIIQGGLEAGGATARAAIH